MSVLDQHFSQLINQGNLAHAYLLTGGTYEAKLDLVHLILKGLVCQSKKGEEDTACGACQACRRVDLNQFSDALYLQPYGQAIKVDQIRQLKDWLTKSPIEADFKMAVIEQADTMNASASNALLTFLEEPTDDVYLILFADEADRLLATIRSRVQQIHLSNESVLDQSQALVAQGLATGHAHIISLLGGDATQRLSEHYQVEEFDQWLKQWNHYFRLLVAGDNQSFVWIQSHLKNYLSVQQALDGLDYLMLLNHSALVQSQLGDEEVTSQPQLVQAYFIQELLKKQSVQVGHLLKLQDQLLITKQQVMANVPAQLVLEGLSIGLSRW